MANSLNKDNVKIWIGPAGTVGADLGANGKVISGYITSFNSSGFGQEFEQIDVAGGNVSSAQASAELEIDMDIILTDGADRDIFQKIKMGEEDFGMIAIQKQISSTEYMWEAVNNIVAPNFEGDFAMDGQWEGSLTTTSTAFDEDGNHNWDYGTNNIENDGTVPEDAGLISGNERTLANGITRSNSW